LDSQYYYSNLAAMSQFLVSARKYRPQSFQDVIGQEQVTMTLKNALKNDKLAHAFLFTGPRGVGKTSCARILAKTINCQHETDANEACNKCDNCLSFNNHAAMNVFELDAASNNSVENIRELIEQVRFAPQMGKYKVYIIDEVHMLSTAAFNAFLKTLEEPPSYAIFILATTEKNKIIPTILSRCQIYDFNRVSVNAIATHLKDICQKEHIQYEDEAIHIIAQKSEGGLRDALSMLDRLVSFTSGHLTTESVMHNLNLLDYDTFFSTVDALLNEDIGECMLIVQKVLARGFDADEYIIGLAEHFRNLLIAKNNAMHSLLNFTEHLSKRYLEQAALADLPMIINALAILNDADIHYRQSKNKRLTAEMALIRICYVQRLVKNNGVVSLEDSKKKIPLAKNIHEINDIENIDPKINQEQNNSNTNDADNKETKDNINIPVFINKTRPIKWIFNEIKSTKNDIAHSDITHKNEIVFDDTIKVNETLLRETIAAFWDTCKTNKKITHANLLSDSAFKIIGNKIIFSLMTIGEMALNEIKLDMSIYLQEKLGKSFLIHSELIKSTVADDVIDENQLFTAKSRYKKMLQSNPEIEKLRARFQLDILD